MKLKRRANWTPEDNERLKAMAADGVPVLRVAAVLKCSTEAVRNQARKLGTSFPSLRDSRKKFADDPESSWNAYVGKERRSRQKAPPRADRR
jgi:hypothetical protein